MIAGRQYVFSIDILNPLDAAVPYSNKYVQVLGEDEVQIGMGWNGVQLVEGNGVDLHSGCILK